jgi:DNA polymerase I-like protein with 3'-5' exonuclease and polymerase domains
MKRVVVLHQNHDEILYQVRPSYAMVAAQKLKELMERSIDINGHKLVVPCEFAKGMNWGKFSKKINPKGLKEVTVP